jgi:DNA-binding transcriptional LysR family regulator
MVDSPGRITLWGIEVFMATADERSISAAAKRLGASPSAVSQQLSNLEAALGARLIERKARPMRLTPAGEILKRRAQVILNEASLARAELAMSDLSKLTRFRLGMIEDFEAVVTPQLLTALAEELSKCQFLLETGASHYLYDLLEARSLDMIVAAELNAGDDWVELHPLLREGFVVAAPRGTVDGAKPMLRQLKRRPLIQYTQRHYMGRLISAHLARQNLSLGHRFELDSYHAILALVGQGAGWTILPPLALMRAERFADQIDVFPLPFEPLSRSITLSARKDTLQEMPARVAETLRPILRASVVDPALARYPFLRGSLELL